MTDVAEQTGLYTPDGFDPDAAGADQAAVLQDVDGELVDALEDALFPDSGGAPDSRPVTDPEAPFGRFANGKPRKSPKRERAPRGSSGTPRPPSAPGRRPPGRPRAVKPSYAEKVQGLLALPTAALALAGTARDSEALVADAATLSEYATPLSTALGDLADTRPEFAAVLDRVLSVGPYGALLAVVVPMTLQFLANHKIMPPVESLGVRSREDVLGIVKQPAAAP